MFPITTTGRRVALGLFSFAAAAPVAMAQDAIHGELGLGVISTPEYPGSDHHRTTAVPVVRLELPTPYAYVGNRYGGTPLQLGLTPLNTEHWVVGAHVSYQSVMPRDVSDDHRLRGLSDIDRSALGGFLFAWHGGGRMVSLRSDTDLSGHGQGTILTLAAQQHIPLGDHWTLSVGPRLVWGNRQHMTTFFGVDPAATPDTTLARYRPAAGFQERSFNIGAQYVSDAKWVYGASVSVGHLMDNASGSPVVRDSSQVSVAAYTAFRF